MENTLNPITKLKTSIKNNWKYILAVLILVLIINGGVLSYFYNKKEGFSPSIKEDKVLKSNFIEENQEIIWDEYINHQLSFSIKIPKIVDGIDRCFFNKKFQVPVKVFEDEENGIVYVSVEYYYEAAWNSQLEKFTGPCEKITYSLESLRKESKKRESKPWLGWAILVRNVKDRSELDKFIKENYGLGCFIKDLIPWGQEGIYEIEIKAWDEGGDLGITDCPVNYAYKALYIPEKNKVISVKLGQECTFGIIVPSGSHQCYDEEMIHSIKVLI